MIPVALELLIRLASYALATDPASLRIILKLVRFIWRVLA